MAKEDGGPAFPATEDIGSGMESMHVGMTLRDWFAGQAMVGIVARFGSDTNVQPIGKEAYGVADAMLEARKG